MRVCVSSAYYARSATNQAGCVRKQQKQAMSLSFELITLNVSNDVRNSCHNSEWKCANTTDTVLVPRKQFHQTALGNCYGLKLPKCWLQFEKKIVSCHLLRIFVTYNQKNAVHSRAILVMKIIFVLVTKIALVQSLHKFRSSIATYLIKAP